MAAPASLRPATEDDVPLILTFIRELAEYERDARVDDYVAAMAGGPVEMGGAG
jgi:hypothetical protein